MSTVIILAVLGLLASVSPSTIVVFILLLATARARINAVAFLIGWSVSLIIVFAVSYGIGGVRATQHGSGRTVVEVIEIMLGAALAFAAARQWRHRDRPRTSSRMAKKFNARLTQLHPWEAATVGVLEQPWTLTAAAAVVLVRDHSAFLVVVFAFLAFALLSTATIGLIFLYFARRPGQAEAHLTDLKDRLVRAGPAIFAIVSAAVGVFLIIDGVIGIVGS
ncbi:MAG TPA: GAP family protein [Streptosporangiaceae bacterium]|nr:GAP family protein [Streptosporangiaceae bacterium]